MKKLIQGLREFKSSYFCANQHLFEQLSHGQKPRVLFITCSDSRIDPNLLTQTQPGELFVIRNAGNIVPPYGSTNGGEGASIEYAIHALNIEHIIVCGHSHCGAMKGLLKLSTLEEEMPLVHAWLTHAEATRRLIKENYSQLEGEELLDVTIAENVLTQIENLRTYPVVHSRLYQGTLHIYAWIFDIDTGEVMAFDIDRHAYISPQSLLPESELDEELLTPLPPGCALPNMTSSTAANVFSNMLSDGNPSPPSVQPNYPFAALSTEQADRIYRGSHRKNGKKHSS
ncbi:MAG: carbonic anhydrase [Leptolyngbyaceae cyanobacterium SL_7_1]|nr:carbonic anhydrase [Leptolyngbyaceae cyanobacterium SL_7_1]